MSVHNVEARNAAAARSAEQPIDPLFLERWSPRAFTGEAIPEGALRAAFEAARWAPSAYNSQPWRFVYARRDTPAWPAFLGVLVPFNQSWAHAASALIIVLSKAKYTPLGQSEPVESATASFDTGAAWASLAFQAHKLGWATHGMAGFDAEAARRLVNAPADAKIEAIVAIGRPGDPNSLPERLRARETPSRRRPLADMVFEGALP